MGCSECTFFICTALLSCSKDNGALICFGIITDDQVGEPSIQDGTGPDVLNTVEKLNLSVLIYITCKHLLGCGKEYWGLRSHLANGDYSDSSRDCNCL